MKDVRQLAKEFVPNHYKLQLTIEREPRKFTGQVEITGQLLAARNAISLHAKELEISAASINGTAVSFALDGDELTLASKAKLQADDCTLQLHFSGTITDKSLHGLYPCYYTAEGQQKEILATQFESHHAREVFPCIDEPAAKATFDLTLTTEKDVAVIANTPEKTRQETATAQTVSFETTPKMSTYLLAFVVGELEYLEGKTHDGVTVRTYATPGQVEYTAFALETTIRALEFYNQYFDLPYPLAKCDLVGVPDFSAAAMENWGCITFRESCFLVDEKNSDVGTKQFAAQAIIHELAHQWFGNLVTMQWWNDLWLNEGFARFMESLVADKLFPEWHLQTDFLATNTAVAQRMDSLENTHPIQVPVHHPDEISTIFDAISYEKGAAALAMLHNYLGDAAFQAGLRGYLSTHQYSNTTTDDLWRALSQSSGKDVASFMQQWVSQPGFPVITITTDAQMHLQQQRFFANPAAQASTQTSTVWPLPLLADAPLPALMTETELTTELPAANLFKLNHDQVGFYFTAYTKAQRAAQKAAIAKGDLAVNDRLGLLNEIFELAEAGYLPTKDALEFMEAYHAETEEHVWSVMASQLGAIRLLIEDDEAATDALNKYVRRLVAQQLAYIGWGGTPDEPLRRRNLRQLLVGLACRAEDSEAVQEALRRFQVASQPEDLPADLKPTIYATAVRHSDDQVVTDLLARYQQTTFAEERLNLTIGICAATSTKFIPTILAFAQKEVKSQDFMYWYAYLMRNHTARPIVWQWTKDNWQWIVDTFGSDKTYDRFPLYAGRCVTTADLQVDFAAFYQPKKDIPALTRSISQAEERIAINVAWRQRDCEGIKSYLLKSSSQSDTAN